RRLWRVAVYAHPDLGDFQRRLIRAAAERELGVPSRYVEDEPPDPYLELVFDQLATGTDWTADDRAALAGKARAQEAQPTSLVQAEELVMALVEARRAAHEEPPAAD